jgi:hypothetical protein
MSIQIGQMMSNMLSELQQTEAKTLELKVGQIVKGMVLQLLGEQDALVNIGGVQLRAKLETPLRQGQVTEFRVQPESNGSQVVLKPVDGVKIPLTDAALGDLLKSLGMNDQPETRQLAKQLQQAGIELTKGNLQRFGSMMEQRPVEVPANEWMESAVIAHKRNLPLTRETVNGLRQALFGQPLLGQLEGLEAKADETVRTMSPLPGKASVEVQELIGKLRQAIQLVKDTAGASVAPDTRPLQERAAGQAGASEPPRPELTGKPAADAATKQPTLVSNGQMEAASDTVDTYPGVPAEEGSAAAREPNRAEGRLRAEQQPSAKLEHAAQPQRQSGDPIQSETNNRQADRTLDGSRRQDVSRTELAASGIGREAESAASRSRPGKSPDTAGQANTAAKQAGMLENDTNSQGRPKTDTTENWISRLFKAVGMDNEHQITRAIDRADHRAQSPSTPVASSALQMAAAPEQGLPAVPDLVRHEAADSLKSILLQLSASDAVPEPLREHAQQTLQQITGQQLLLSPDRGAVLTHVTMFLPVSNGGGDEHRAAVHVQARKGKRGEIDARNCRLLFDLNMQTLGLTLVDVQVYDKKVHLQVHNDMPFLAAILEQYRGEIEEGLRDNGYQFMALKCTPFPEQKRVDAEGAAGELSPARTAAASAYHIMPYKGVDVRI